MWAPSTEAARCTARDHLVWGVASALSAALLVYAGVPARVVPLIATILAATVLAGMRGAWQAVALGSAAWALAHAAGLAPLPYVTAACMAVVAIHRPFETDRADPWLAAFAGLGAAGFVSAYAPEAPTLVAVALTALGQGLALWPAVRRHNMPDVPWRWDERRLAPEARQRVVQATTLYREMRPLAPDVPTRRGLRDVAAWVTDLEIRTQTLAVEAQRARAPDLVLPDGLASHPWCAAARAHDAARASLAEKLALERDRHQAASLHALAWLTHARTQLAWVAAQPGGEVAPDLEATLRDLRRHARDLIARGEATWAWGPGDPTWATRPMEP